MKTNNFAINLMVPGQAEKDIVFNESILFTSQKQYLFVLIIVHN